MRLVVNWRKEDAGGMPLVQLAVAQNGHAWTPPRCQPLYMSVEPQFMRKSVNKRWYRRLSCVEIIPMPVRYSHNLENKSEHFTGSGRHKW
jgi:hypothetical protein